MSEIKNAVIRSASIETEDHSILTFGLSLDYGSTGQTFGGYALDGGRPRTYCSCRWIRALLEALEKRSWGDLAGTSVRVKIEGHLACLQQHDFAETVLRHPTLDAAPQQMELADAVASFIRGSMRLHQAVEAFSAEARKRAQS